MGPLKVFVGSDRAPHHWFDAVGAADYDRDYMIVLVVASDRADISGILADRSLARSFAESMAARLYPESHRQDVFMITDAGILNLAERVVLCWHRVEDGEPIVRIDPGRSGSIMGWWRHDHRRYLYIQPAR